MKLLQNDVVVLVVFLSLLPWPGPPLFRISCSRDQVKLVRHIVQTKWIPLLDKYQVRLPLECPFHPQRDVYGPQLAATLRHRPSQWTCGLCGKSFYEERHLDLHFDNRHRSYVNKAEDAVCLADYCDIMRCQVLESLRAHSPGPGASSTDVELWRDAGERSALQPAGPRHLARVSPADQRARRADNCPKGQVDVDTEDEDGSGEGDHDVDADANHTAELCDADGVDAALPAPDDARRQRLADLQRLKANCDPQHLQALKIDQKRRRHTPRRQPLARRSGSGATKRTTLHLEIEPLKRRNRKQHQAMMSPRGLQVRCEQLVHDCIATLLLRLTTQQFKELQDEMQRAVCWYLSCDRYWQDGAGAARAFPWPLLLGATTLLTLAVCMCYYIIWIVFDSEDMAAGSASASLAQSSPSRAADSRASHPDDADDSADHYIYVTYPPDLKRRLLESCYNRTTRL